MDEIRRMVHQIKQDIESTRKLEQSSWHKKLEELLLAKILADKESFAKQLAAGSYRVWFAATDVIESKEFDWSRNYKFQELSEKLSTQMELTVKLSIGEYIPNLKYTNNALDRVGCLIYFEN